MKISELIIPTRPVFVTPEQSFDVRGIAYNDLVFIGFQHTPALKQAYEMFEDHRNGGEPFTIEVVKKMLISIAKETPDAVAAIIACANDDHSEAAMKNLRKLPLGVQVVALGEIMELSLRSDTDIKKLQEMVLDLVSLTTKTVELVTPQPDTQAG